MDVILDTNIYRQDLALRNVRFEVLFDYLEKSGSRLVLPKLVEDELRGVVQRELRERTGKLLTAHTELMKYLPHSSGVRAALPDVEAEVRAYMAYFRTRLERVSLQEPAYREPYLDDVITRAIERRRPCSSGGEHIRDAVLWLIVLDAAAAAEHNAVVFISHNTSDFADSNNTLHPELRAECAIRDVTVHYFPSLAEFAREHSTHVRFATSTWLDTQIERDAVLERAHDHILVAAERYAERVLDEGEAEFTGDVEVVGGELSAPELYAHKRGDGSVQLAADYVGQAEVAFGLAWKPDWERYHGSDSDSRFSVSPDWEYGWRTIEFDLRIGIEAIARDKTVTDWKVATLESL